MNLDLTSATKLLSDKITTWYELLIKSIPNVIVAFLVLIVFFVIATIINKLSDKVFKKVFSGNAAVSNLMSSVLHIITLLIGVFISLEILNLEKTVTSILAGAGVIGLALGFAFQEIASNFVSGIFIAFRKPYRLGDIVEINDYFGEVTKINLRTTSITTFKGLEAIIPNKTMFTEAFTNYTTTAKRRIFLDVGVSYGDDLDKVKKVTKEAIEKLEGLMNNSEVEIYFKEFGSSSINLVARFWINYNKNTDFWQQRSDAIMSIKKAYDENDIMIPFPIRTLDFGIKGGEKLNTMLSERAQE